MAPLHLSNLTSLHREALYWEAYQQAERAGLVFRSLMLKPQDKLVDIIRQSRELALESKGGEEGNSQ